jgi:putative ABC transport system ATP-binding protein
MSTAASTPIDTPKQNSAEQSVRTLDVKRSYKMGTEVVKALQGVTISIYRGEYISIMGPSGSGKSTLFNMIGGLDKPSEGKVYIDEVDIAQLDSYELAWMRCHKIGYIFQTFNLIPVMTALENVMMPMIFAHSAQRNVRRPAAARGHRPRLCQ